MLKGDDAESGLHLALNQATLYVRVGSIPTVPTSLTDLLFYTRILTMIGNRDIAEKPKELWPLFEGDEILITENGSRLYGTYNSSSDHDYMGVFVENPETVFSCGRIQTRSLSDRGPEEKSSSESIDGTLYSVRHLFHLLSKGNPSLLCLLFVPDHSIVLRSDLGREILENKELFISRQAGPAFKGYMHSQLERLTGKKKGHIPNRPELVERFGWDVKYGMQVARLALQGIEYMRSGHISLPMELPEREICMEIRNGYWRFEEAIQLLTVLEKKLDEAIENSSLPETVDDKKISQLSRNIHERHWWT